ncbi:uncharacterized protein LOC135206538 [Macrobrachium nipponense]|uniref:uncharacterized protein LOC135206538 n=1 Tax=Macrobrachium nipponense TaxID=159736 RepID=UPI0030C88ED9
MDFGGEKPPLKICSLGVVKVTPPFLFKNLTPDCKPVANKSRLYSLSDKKFIEAETERCNKREEEKPYTAFEAGGKLYEFSRIPFGVKNGVAAFQRVLDEILKKEKNKCDFKVRSIKLLGYSVTDGEIKPDPERLQPLWNLSPPKDAASLCMTMGLLAHYSRWIPKFSEKICPLTQANGFPLSTEALLALGNLKKDIASAVVTAIDPSSLFTVETDASDHAIAATLTQNDRPVAFFSRTLTRSEQGHSSVEKEAYAIVEALRKWRHYLIGHHFKLITDQRSVKFMFDSKSNSKIKNDKITRWRVELSCFHYVIVYHPGTENIPTDALSRICGATTSDKLQELHGILCHPGISRMMHFVQGRNLPYSVEEVRKITTSCQVCLELKPQFIKSSGQLIKATQPFERLNLDFKGPVPSQSRNKYLLTVVDEFSRFPFVFPCADMTTRTVIGCLVQLFALFGMPAYIHTDRGACFMSEELKDFLMKKGVATSRTTPYNPKGNGQAEKYNGIIWKTLTLALKTRNLDVSQWETVLPDALHCICSLLCTSTYSRTASDNRESTDAGVPVSQSEVPEELSVANAPQEIARGLSHVDIASQHDTLQESRTVPQQVASPPPLRRSERVRQPPKYLQDYSK